MGPNGRTVMKEFRGPPDVETWAACWVVYERSMIMAQAVIPPRVAAYPTPRAACCGEAAPAPRPGCLAVSALGRVGDVGPKADSARDAPEATALRTEANNNSSLHVHSQGMSQVP